VAGFVLALLITIPARAQVPSDSATLTVNEVAIGQRAVLDLEIRTVAGATVEVDPSAPSWNGVEVVAVTPGDVIPEGDGVVHRIRVLIAPFRPGAGTFEPSVAVISADGASIRTLPPLSWDVRATLAPGAPLELSPLREPGRISGAQSPLLVPALGLAAVSTAAIVVLVAFFGGRYAIRRARAGSGVVADEAEAPVGFEGVEPLLEHDPVAAYRSLAVIVRSCIATRYGLPATALTTSELRARMESSGADRFLARLVGGFLEECDSVVYAGYRPAGERRRADLNMAREIVGEPG
jgi:hypothetical protein